MSSFPPVIFQLVEKRIGRQLTENERKQIQLYFESSSGDLRSRTSFAVRTVLANTGTITEAAASSDNANRVAQDLLAFLNQEGS